MKKRWLCLLLSVCLLITTAAVSLTALAGEETETHYVIDTVRDEDTYIVTVKCNWTDFQMLNGQFLFTYPTDELELLLDDRENGPIDPANALTPLPAAEVGVDKETGEIRLAFISSDGEEFTDGWVTMLVLPFRLLHEDVTDLNINMSTETLVAAGDQPGEKVDVLKETDVPADVTFEQPIAEVPTTVSTTTTTTTTTTNAATTTAAVIDPAVGAEYYSVDIFVAGTQATVTVRCDYSAFFMLNGQFVFSYPTDTLDLVLGEQVGPIDPANKMSSLPAKQVAVDEALGTVNVAFMSSSGVEFLDGPVDMLKMEFDIKDTAASSFELTMQCGALMEWTQEDPRGRDTVAAGKMPSALRWNVSLAQTPTTTTTTTTTTAPKKLLGDVNGDKRVDSTDARLTLQCAVKKIAATAIDTTVADVNGDHSVDSTDARLILQRAVSKITKFPVE